MCDPDQDPDHPTFKFTLEQLQGLFNKAAMQINDGQHTQALIVEELVRRLEPKKQPPIENPT